MTTNYQSGHDAEKLAAKYLEEAGLAVREMNWKTKYCEIDIIAEKDGRLYFVEVKSRRNTEQGYGLDYITPKKLKQMRFAAEFYVSSHGWTGEYQLAAIGIDGDDITFIDEL